MSSDPHLPEDDNHFALRPGTLVKNFRIIKVLGQGGFGITYRAEDTSRGEVVAIKEMFPCQFALRSGDRIRPLPRARDVFDRLLKRFFDEATTLLRFGHLANTVRVRSYFQENGTGYIVMDFEAGSNLADYLAARPKPITEAEVEAILLPLVENLAEIHKGRFLHRDIKPANIIIRPNGQPVLIDFGASREAAWTESQALPFSTMARIVSQGYTPWEQYDSGEGQGPWTDLYALGAVAYRMVTGATPPDGLTRKNRQDNFVPALSAAPRGFSKQFLKAIDWTLSVPIEDRPQSVEQWREVLGSHGGLRPPAPKPQQAPVEVLSGKWPDPGCVFRDWGPGRQADPTLQEMVVIPAGTFTMGAAPGEEEREGVPEKYRGWAAPQQQVTIARAFALGRKAVTRGQFKAFVQATGHRMEGGAIVWNGTAWERNVTADWRSPGFAQTDEHPVVCVSWEDAQAYVRWLSDRTGLAYRLPSEAEWEYACRARTTTARYWGDDRERMVKYAQTANETTKKVVPGADGWLVVPGETGYAYTAPVGKFLPNAFGLFDMLGNVWEWCEDCWNQSYQGMPEAVMQDGRPWATGDCSFRVLRGGSWYTFPSGVGSAVRICESPFNRGIDLGFRVARTL